MPLAPEGAFLAANAEFYSSRRIHSRQPIGLNCSQARAVLRASGPFCCYSVWLVVLAMLLARKIGLGQSRAGLELGGMCTQMELISPASCGGRSREGSRSLRECYCDARLDSAVELLLQPLQHLRDKKWTVLWRLCQTGVDVRPVRKRNRADLCERVASMWDAGNIRW